MQKKRYIYKKIVISIYKLESKYKVLGDFYIIIYFELMYTLASAKILLLLLLLYLFIHFIHGTRNNYTQNLQHRRLKAYLENDDCNDECHAESSTIKLLSKKCNLLLAESYLCFFFYFS